jgi:hypothetical protein
MSQPCIAGIRPDSSTRRTADNHDMSDTTLSKGFGPEAAQVMDFMYLRNSHPTQRPVESLRQTTPVAADCAARHPVHFLPHMSTPPWPAQVPEALPLCHSEQHEPAAQPSLLWLLSLRQPWKWPAGAVAAAAMLLDQHSCFVSLRHAAHLAQSESPTVVSEVLVYQSVADWQISSLYGKVIAVHIL